MSFARYQAQQANFKSMFDSAEPVTEGTALKEGDRIVRKFTSKNGSVYYSAGVVNHSEDQDTMVVYRPLPEDHIWFGFGTTYRKITKTPYLEVRIVK